MNKDYLDILRESCEQTGSIVCMGLDPILEYLPVQTGAARADLNGFYAGVFRKMKQSGVYPGAFKPNIGYFSALDRPREGDFSGSLALADLLDLLEGFFPGIPVILDAKRGDIARSSLNYGEEAFTCWRTDAVTVSPYMGTDSVRPFMFENKGIYVLNRTSNPGGKDLQDLETGRKALYLDVAEVISRWSVEHPGVGAVVGATNPQELEDIARFYADSEAAVPLLIPGVGSQGGSAKEVLGRLEAADYDLSLVRINSSSGITHPWKGNTAPEDWPEAVTMNLKRLNDEIGVLRV